MASFEVLRQGASGGDYEQVSVEAEQFLRTPQQGIQFVFTDWKIFDASSSLKELLSSKWSYPRVLWTKTCREVNGYAGSSHHLQDNNTVVNTSWFQFFIKQLRGGVNASNKQYEYDWYEMSFHICILPAEASVVFCFKTPHILQSLLQEAVNATARHSRPPDKMAFLQSLIVVEVSKMYDKSIWTLRDEIRDIEKRRSGAYHVDSALDFAQLHDLARHTIHSSEVITVAVDTVTAILGEYRTVMCGCPGVIGTSIKPNCPHNEITFWLGLLQNLGRRAQSLNERLSNEINLGFNVVVQRDSRETVEISRLAAVTSSAARVDSASMKTIAVVTLAFLPATFVCTIFSMSFFTLNVDDETGRKHWLISEKFWVYWVITVPLTILTLICWSYGQRKEEDSQRSRQSSWKSTGA